MSIINLTVVKATASKNGGYVTKLQNKTVVNETTAFGEMQQTKQTTFMAKFATAPVVGFKADLDLSAYDITERPYTIPVLDEDGKPNENAGEIIQLKWLSPKLVK